MGRSRYKIIDPTTPYFVTCTVLHWIPVFTRQETVEILLDSLQFLQKEGLKLYAYVILENHLHLIVQSENLETDLARFKSFTARKLLDFLNEHKLNNHRLKPEGFELRAESPDTGQRPVWACSCS